MSETNDAMKIIQKLIAIQSYKKWSESHLLMLKFR